MSRAVYDGQGFHEIPPGLTVADWIRGLTTPVLERIGSGYVRSPDVDPRRVVRLVRCELERRGCSRDDTRAIETAAGVQARRQWINLMPVLTNYGGS